MQFIETLFSLNVDIRIIQTRSTRLSRSQACKLLGKSDKFYNEQDDTVIGFELQGPKCDRIATGILMKQMVAGGYHIGTEAAK